MYWKGLRDGKSLWLGLLGGVILFAYAVIPTLQNEAAFCRAYAAFGGSFIILSIAWAQMFDGWRPDRFDLIGAGIALVGVAIIIWGRNWF